MDGRDRVIFEDMFEFAKDYMQRYKVAPYVSYIVKNGEIITRGFNRVKLYLNEFYGHDITQMSDVVTIREAQESLDTGDLSGYSLYSFFEPTILGFDIALFVGIKDFKWCINASSTPQHYNHIKYGPLDYVKNNPGKITIENGIMEEKALELVRAAESQNFYPNNLFR